MAVTLVNVGILMLSYREAPSLSKGQVPITNIVNITWLLNLKGAVVVVGFTTTYVTSTYHH